MGQYVYAHRGASGYAPENTLAAFALAASQGAHGVELDVHLSRDGVPVVAHDETIDRVSDGTGLISGMTVAELKRHRFGKGFPAYGGERIPTLEEVFALLLPTGLSVNVELKTNINPYPGIEQACLSLAARMGMERRVLYSSFHHESLLRVKAIDPSQPCGLLYSAAFVPGALCAYATSLGMDALHPHFLSVLSTDLCAQAQRAGLEVNPWTVNDEDTLRAMIRLGANRIITNYPDRALALLG